jgi:hypothetical protein
MITFEIGKTSFLEEKILETDKKKLMYINYFCRTGDRLPKRFYVNY